MLALDLMLLSIEDEKYKIVTGRERVKSKGLSVAATVLSISISPSSLNG